MTILIRKKDDGTAEVLYGAIRIHAKGKEAERLLGRLVNKEA